MIEAGAGTLKRVSAWIGYAPVLNVAGPDDGGWVEAVEAQRHEGGKVLGFDQRWW